MSETEIPEATQRQYAKWWIELNEWRWPKELGPEETPEKFLGGLHRKEGSRRRNLMERLQELTTERHVDVVRNADPKLKGRLPSHVRFVTHAMREKAIGED